MSDHVRISADVSLVANDGTIYISWPDGSTTTEDEQQVGAVLLTCRRARPYPDLTTQCGADLVDRLLRQGLLVRIGSSDVLGLHTATLGGDLLPRPTPPTEFLAFDDARLLREYGSGHTRDLPDPEAVSLALSDALTHRSSARSFSGRPLAIRSLSTLVATALGTGPERSVLPRVSGGPPARPAYPSPGALYPVELALLAWDVAGLDDGAYRYQAIGHRLTRIGETTSADAPHLAGESAHGAAALIVLWCDLLSSTFSKYGGKGYRLTLLEAGHIMQNLVLVATALDLPALPVAGIRDDEVARTIALVAPEQVPVYALLVGGRP